MLVVESRGSRTPRPPLDPCLIFHGQFGQMFTFIRSYMYLGYYKLGS
jgi:hypothetical protein